MKFKDPDAWQNEAWEHRHIVPVMSAIEATIQDYRDREPKLGEDHDWWVLYPDWMFEYREKIKANWYRLAGFPLGNLRGFYFADRWPNIGQRFTYDPVTGEWDR